MVNFFLLALCTESLWHILTNFCSESGENGIFGPILRGDSFHLLLCARLNIGHSDHATVSVGVLYRRAPLCRNIGT